jgi:hypothetical protein
MMKVVALLFAGFGLLAAGEALPTEPEVWGYGKLGILYLALSSLIAAFGYLLRVEMPAARKQFAAILDRITDRWDGWEKIRHDDHEGLQSVLRETVVNCADTRAAMQTIASHDADRAHVDADRMHADKGLAHKDADRAHEQAKTEPKKGP